MDTLNKLERDFIEYSTLVDELRNDPHVPYEYEQRVAKLFREWFDAELTLLKQEAKLLAS